MYIDVISQTMKSKFSKQLIFIDIYLLINYSTDMLKSIINHQKLYLLTS